jgi:hypothetical protein
MLIFFRSSQDMACPRLSRGQAIHYKSALTQANALRAFRYYPSRKKVLPQRHEGTVKKGNQLSNIIESPLFHLHI